MDLPRALVTSGLLAVLSIVIDPIAPARADSARLDGLLAPSRQASLKPRVDGVLQAIWVHVGDSVRRDQSLGRVSNARIDEEVRQAEGRDGETENALRLHRQLAAAALDRAASHRADMEVALARVEADRNLAARVIVARDLHDAQQQEQLRRRELRSIERTLEQATAQSYGRAARDRARALEELRAPFEGTVTGVGGEPGMRVSANAGPTLLTVAQLDPLVLVAQAPLEAFRYVPTQGPAQVTLDELPGKTFPGSIAALNVIYSPPNGILTVTVSVPNARGLLRPGMHAHASLTLTPLPLRPEVVGPQPVYARR